MRTLLCLFGLLLFTSCSEERRLLNRIEGVFETTEFVVTDDTTGNVLFTALPTLQFPECDTESNGNGGRCEVTIVTTDGTSFNYRYQLTTSTQGPDYISFRPTRESITIDNDLTRALTGTLAFELRDKELRMFTNEITAGTRDTIQGSRNYQVSIVANKR